MMTAAGLVQPTAGPMRVACGSKRQLVASLAAASALMGASGGPSEDAVHRSLQPFLCCFFDFCRVHGVLPYGVALEPTSDLKGQS